MPKAESHIQLHQDALPYLELRLETLEFFDLKQIWDAFAFRALTHTRFTDWTRDRILVRELPPDRVIVKSAHGVAIF